MDFKNLFNEEDSINRAKPFSFKDDQYNTMRDLIQNEDLDLISALKKANEKMEELINEGFLLIKKASNSNYENFSYCEFTEFYEPYFIEHDLENTLYNRMKSEECPIGEEIVYSRICFEDRLKIFYRIFNEIKTLSILEKTRNENSEYLNFYLNHAGYDYGFSGPNFLNIEEILEIYKDLK